MKAKLGNALLIIAALILLAAGAAAAAALLWESGGRDRSFTSHGTLPGGSKAFYLLLEESGHPVQRWERPLTMLTEEGGGVLFIVEPRRRPLRPAEAEAVRDWVEQGNRLVLLGMEQSVLYEAFGLKLAATQFSPEPLRVKANSPHVLLEEVGSLELRAGATFTAESDGDILAGDRENSYILWKAAGEGEIIAITDAGMITNEALGRGDNLIFLLNTAGAFHEPLAVFIDEYHHGFGREYPLYTPSAGPGFITEHTWPAMQLALFTLLLLLTAGRRFAAPRPLPEPSTRALSHTVAAAAAIYRKAGARRAPFSYLHAGLKRRLIRKYRLSYDPDPAEIARLGELTAGLERQALERDFSRFAAVSGGENISAAELLELSQRLDLYRKEFNL